jgi:UDP-glucuronate 4-epimerase
VPAPDPGYSAANPDPATSDAPYRVFNIGNHQPVLLMDFIGCIEQQVGRQAEKRLLPMQPGDVAATYADTAALEEWIDFAPSTAASAGTVRLVDWSRHYYQV